MSEHTPGPCPHCGVNASEVMPLVVKLRLQRDELLAALEANLRDFGLVNEYIALVAKAKQTLSGSDKFKIPAIHPFTHAVKETAAAIQAARGE